MSYHRLQNQLYLDPCGFLLRLRLQAGLAVLQGALSFALFLLSITDFLCIYTLKKPPADPAIGADGGSGCRSLFNRTTGDSFPPLKCQYALHFLQFPICVRLASVFLLSSVRISCYLRLKSFQAIQRLDSSGKEEGDVL